MRSRLFSLLTVLALGSPVAAQTPGATAATALTADDYARAERFLASGTDPLVYGATVAPTWLGDGRFWYRNTVRGGREFVVVDPSSRRRALAFDHARLASALSAAAGATYQAGDLPLAGLRFDGQEMSFDVNERRFACDLRSYVCRAEQAARARPGRNDVASPDGRRAAFIRGFDLWMRDLDTGVETRLTTDGIEDFGYGTNNAGWTKGDRPVLAWSPDSRRIATFQHDGRGVGMEYLVSTKVGHGELQAWRYPLPEDSVIFRIHRVVIDVEAPEGRRVTRLQMPPDQHRSTVCDHILCGGTFADVAWTSDGAQLVFVSSSRDHKRASVRVADARTGVVRDLFEEVEETFYESGGNWRLLSESNEVMWFSQRDNWGHLYLYDLATGRLKHQITKGDWNVLSVVRVDPREREVWFVGNEREPGDPYFRYLYRIGLDGSDLELLTPDSADHSVSLSPNGRFFVDSWSTPVIPPVTVVRDVDGREVMKVEQADISSLVATGWQAPIPFEVKARDGVTDLHGLLFKPLAFDSTKKYPVINYLYPGPQSGSVGTRSFRASRSDFQSLAELGFVVVELDAMGTPMRSKAFHEAYYGNMGDNGLPDQITGIEQLARRHPWMDIDKVGIYGHSGGGFAAAGAIMRYPDFYKVAVSQAGNHDNRNYEDDWGEKWQGLLEVRQDGTTNYDNQANQLLAKNLKGKLLIAHGTMDNNVPPSNTLLVVDALIAANKDFDLLMLPNRSHGFGSEPYMMRRRWDYFVRHLLGAEPPAGYEIGRAVRPVG